MAAASLVAPARELEATGASLNERGTLFDDRDKRSFPLVDDALQREEPAVDRVDPERQPRHVIDEDRLRL
jgi:hypothetical protein